MPQKQPIEATVEFLASQHESLPSSSEETAAAEPVANSEMPQFAPPTVTGELGRLGKYRIQKELGRGGMGAVYLAFDERLQRQIALKVMLPKFAANANAKDRFLREARAAARISSDHVVNIFEADEIDGTPYIALQLLQGYPLEEYLKKKGSPSLPQIIRIGREIAIGLAAAHKLGLVHRDIKPGNVWLEAPNGRVKILDFGLAKPVEGTDSAELTAMGSLVGTPAYMAPEQGRGQTLDGRADLFSLGCVLYRLCTGKLPFARSTLMSILIAVATEEPTPVRELNPNVPEPLAELIRRLMAKNAADRPANAQAVVKELDGLIEPTQKSAEVIPHVFYAPMAVSVQESNPFADIDTVMDSETAEPHAEVAKLPPRKFPAILVGSLVFALIAIVLAGFIIIKITNKDGTVTEVKVPKDSKIEVDGKTVTTGPKKPEPLVKLDPLPPWTAPKAIPVGESPFDKLDPNAIPKEERFDWQPKELVGVIGSHRGCDPYYNPHPSHVFSPDGRWLIRNNTPMLIWDAKTLVLRYSQYAFGKAAFSSDGKTMAIGSGNTVDLIDLSGAVPTLIQRRTVVPPGEGNGVHGAAIFNDGKSIAAGTGQGHLRIFDREGSDDTPRMILREKTNSGTAHSFNIMVTPDGKRLGAICGEPEETKPGEFAIRFWDISGAAPKDLFSIPHNRKEGWLSALLSVDGKTLFVTATNGKWVEAYDVSGSEPKQLDRVEWKEGVAGQFIGAVLDGNTIRLSVSDGMQLWQFADGKLKKIKDLPANTAAVSDDMTRIVTSSPEFDGLALNLCDMSGKRLVEGVPPTVFSHNSSALPFVADNRVFTTTTPFRSWEVKDGGWQVAQKGARFPGYGAPNVPSPDEKFVAVSIGEGVLIYSISTIFAEKPEPITVLPHDAAKNPAVLFCWAADNKTIFTAQKDGAVLAWDLTQTPPKSRPILKGEGLVTGLTASNNGRHLAFVRNGDFVLLELAGKNKTVSLPLPGQARQASFSPDGAHLLLHTRDGSLYRQPTAKPQEQPERIFEEGALHNFELSRDGKLLVTSNGQTLRWFDISTTPIRKLGEWKQFVFDGSFQIAPDSRHVLLHQAGMVYVLRLPDLSFAADRKAAEYVLSIGGTVYVNGQDGDIKAIADLPKVAFQLTDVNLIGNKQVNDVGMSNFNGCKNLKAINLDGTQVTDVGLAYLKNNPKLTLLALRTIATDAGMINFKDCKNLTYLYLSDSKVTDAGLAFFSDCKDLTNLGLEGTQVSDTGLAHFKECKNLTSLVLTNTKVSEAGVVHFKGCKNLTHLYLGGTQVTDAGLAHFKDCKNLLSISLDSTQVTDAGLAHFKDCKNLLTLTLQKTKVTAAKFEELKKAFPKCRIVSDHGTHDPTATFKNSLGMEFVKVPKGTGWLGGGAGKQGETKVVIEQDFYLGKYEVTQEEWEAVTGQNPSHFSRKGVGKDAVKDIPDADLKRFPVEMVSWDDCQLFIKRLNEKEKDTGWVYRLPKEAEWEYACRGGPVDKLDSAFDFYFAKPTNTLLPEQANFEHGKGLKRTCKVGSYEPNAIGLCDMHGNVWEWCDDKPSHVNESQGMFWGGSWRVDGLASSSHIPKADRYNYLGLRLARVPVGPAVAVPATTDPDRKAAEWVLSIGGTVRLSGQEQDIKAAPELPKEAFQLTGVGLYENKQVSDAGLANFKDCRSLTILYLQYSQPVTDAGLANFKDCKNLTLINLLGTQVTDAGLAHFKDCKNLTDLNLIGTQVTDAGLANFKDCKDLTHLHLTGCVKVSDAGLAHFKDCKNLTILHLQKTKVTAAKFEELKAAIPKCKIVSDYGTYEPK